MIILCISSSTLQTLQILSLVFVELKYSGIKVLLMLKGAYSLFKV